MENKILSIGHSNKPIEELIQKIKENKVDILIDVRTNPFSRFCPHFTRTRLEPVIRGMKVEYLYRGKNIGGLGENIGWDIAIDEATKLSSDKTVLIMCSEGDPNKCHRQQEIEPALNKKGVKMEHILWTPKEKKNKTKKLL